ncbi:MAG: AsmA-like C-terminal region-containing protein [Bacteroidota bacterium]
MENNESKKPTVLLKTLKWFFLSVLSLIVLASATGFIIVNYYGDTIKNVFIHELNTQLRSEIYAKDISFTVFEHFPYASLKFSGISAKDATDLKQKDTLLKAESLLLNFNVLDLYKQNYKITRIDIRKGFLHLKIYQDLSDNFHFWKDTPRQAGSKIDFRLENVSLVNMRIIYDNHANKQNLNILAREVALKGRFRDQSYQLRVNGIVVVKEFLLTDESLAKGKEVKLDLEMAADNERGLYTFQKGNLELGKLSFKTQGTILANDKDKQLDFSLLSKETDLQSLILELPASWQKYFENYDFKGDIAFHMTLKGAFMGKGIPRIQADFSLANASAKRKKEEISLEGIKLQGIYIYEQKGDSGLNLIDLKSFNARLKGGEITGSARIEGFVKPLIHTKFKASVELADLHQFLYPENIEKLTGKVDLQLQFAGRLKSNNTFSVSDFLDSEVAGILKCSGTEFKLKGQNTTLEKTSGTFTFNNNDVRAEDMKGSVSGNTFTLNGMFSNLLPYIFNKNQVLGIQAELSFSTLDLATLFEHGKSNDKSSLALAFPDMIQGDLSISASHLSFARFKALNVKTTIRYSAQRLFVRTLSMNALAGQISASGSVDASQGKSISCYGKLNFTNIDIMRTFYEMGNFGQDYIIHDNLKGTGTGNTEFSFLMGPDFHINPASILATTSLAVSNGELNNYKTIQGLGKFIRVDDLSHVRFSSLQNDIVIRDSKIIIPQMNVSSDALNFKISGTHSFNNELNYKFQVKLSDILWKKARAAKKENDEFGIMETDPKSGGGTTLFISLTGTVEKPLFKYDIGSVSKKVKTNLSAEKQNLGSALKAEFGKNRAGLDSLTLIEREDLKKQENGKFLFEWEGKRVDSSSVKSRKAESPTKKTAEKAQFKVDWDEEPAKK